MPLQPFPMPSTSRFCCIKHLLLLPLDSSLKKKVSTFSIPSLQCPKGQASSLVSKRTSNTHILVYNNHSSNASNPSPSSFAETEALNSYSSIFISLSQQFIQQKRTAAASKALWKLGKKKRTKKKKEASIELRIEGPLWRCALHIRVSSRFNFEPFCAASFFWSAAATPICHSGTNGRNIDILS